MKRRLIISAALLCIAVSIVVALNWLNVQQPLNTVVKEDPRNAGIKASAHYQYWIRPDRVVFDLGDVSDSNSRADVFRLLLQFSEALKERNYSTVILAFRGKDKFVLTGEYFKTLGKEYSWQNPVYTMRTLPYKVKRPDGSVAFEEPQGGWLYVLGAEIEDHNKFHDEWYLTEMSKTGT